MADTKVYLSGGRIQGRSDDALLTAIPQTSWKELGRTTLSSEGDTIDVSITGSVKTNLMLLVHLVQDSADTSNNPNFYYNFGYSTIDTDDNYAYRRSHGGGGDSTSVDQASLSGWGEYGEYFHILNIRNVAATEKLVFLDTCAAGGNTGYGTAPNRTEIVGKWANTSNQLDKIRVTNTSNGNYGVGSEVVVLGCNDDEADSGTNFWQELGTATAVGGEDTLTATLSSSKKYLMFDLHKLSSGTADCNLRVNGDSSSIYAWRQSSNGGTDGAYGTTNRVGIDNGGNAGASYSVGYIVNVANKEKLFIAHSVQDISPPSRREVVGKWSNATDAITSVDMSQVESGSFAAGSKIRVWGSN